MKKLKIHKIITVISTNMEEVQTEGNANMKKSLIVYFSYGENSELPQDVDLFS